MYVADEEHYTEVFRRMTEVKHSLKIATGDLKNFNVTIERDGGEEKLRLCDFFLSLVERGVQVQMVCMKPFGFYLYTKENCPQLLESSLFELRYNGHNHEAGMLVWGESMMQAPLQHFERAWNDPDTLKHTWKRFTTKAKEFLRKD